MRLAVSSSFAAASTVVGQLLVEEVAAPGEDLQLAVVAIIRVRHERLHVGVGIEVVGEPGQQHHLVLPRAHLADDLLVLAGQQLRLDADTDARSAWIACAMSAYGALEK